MNKIFMLTMICFFVSGCSLNSILKPDPTGDNELDVYVQKWIEGKNVTFCQKVVDKEHDLDGYFCLETLNAENKYYIPSTDWYEKGFELKFLRVSKLQLRAKFDKDEFFRDYLCKENPPCSYGELESLDYLEEYRE